MANARSCTPSHRSRCSSSAASGPQGSTSNDGGGGGSSGGHGGDGSGGILDALTDPTPTANADPTQSGTRLKVQYYAGADGSKQTAGMVDSTLNVYCNFALMSDGTIRCVPWPSPGSGFVLFSGTYADASCSQPLAVAPKGCAAPPPYALEEGSPSCGTTVWHVFPISAAYTGASYYTLSGTTCSGPSPTSGFTTGDLYTTGAELEREEIFGPTPSCAGGSSSTPPRSS
jgi:hypothetical protein